jgi:hypothetical protein
MKVHIVGFLLIYESKMVDHVGLLLVGIASVWHPVFFCQRS